MPPRAKLGWAPSSFPCPRPSCHRPILPFLFAQHTVVSLCNNYKDQHTVSSPPLQQPQRFPRLSTTSSCCHSGSQPHTSLPGFLHSQIWCVWETIPILYYIFQNCYKYQQYYMFGKASHYFTICLGKLSLLYYMFGNARIGEPVSGHLATVPPHIVFTLLAPFYFIQNQEPKKNKGT